MRDRLFAKTDKSFLTIDFKKFIEAIEKSDSAAIDAMLEAKMNGYELELDKEINGTCGNTALRKALEKRDIETAAKLIRAGAKTTFTRREWVHDDNDCYPYGGYETITSNVFASSRLTHDDMMKLMSLVSANQTADSANTNRP